jgi:hypothetical protein
VEGPLTAVPLGDRNLSLEEYYYLDQALGSETQAVAASRARQQHHGVYSPSQKAAREHYLSQGWGMVHERRRPQE